VDALKVEFFLRSIDRSIEVAVDIASHVCSFESRIAMAFSFRFHGL
jgi:hypothetical protein